MLLSPGVSSESPDKVMNKISELNKPLNNSVVILSFQIGDEKQSKLSKQMRVYYIINNDI